MDTQSGRRPGDRRILLIPLTAGGGGTGHLRRMLALALRLPGTVRILTGSRDVSGIMEKVAHHGLEQVFLDFERARSGVWDIVVFDHRETPFELQDSFRFSPLLIGLDEGGTERTSMDYLLDILPLPAGNSPANLRDSAFLDLPENRRRPPESLRRVLVTFGGEDPAGLTAPCVRTLAGDFFPPEAIDVVRGPLFASLSLPEGVNVLESPENLKEQLAFYDLVVTSFGLTAYEAARAGAAVLLLNPSGYHRRLSRLAGFPEIGVGSVEVKKLSSALAKPERLVEASRKAAPDERKDLAVFIASLDFSGKAGCPACDRRINPAVFRTPFRSFFRCRECGLLYQRDFSPEKIRYGKEYFFQEYQKQYGKSYLEDFSTIRNAGEQRLDQIRRVRKQEGSASPGTLLDIGCAYGPFLAAAKAAGYMACGTDISEDAVQHVRDKLDIPAVVAPFPEFHPREAFGVEHFDVVSMWYVIEHFQELGNVLQAVHGLLKPGGVFAFSTPNGRGISARSDFHGFLGRSPKDHFSIWDPKHARSLLKRFGFSLVRVRVTGHHPERFPFMGKFCKNESYPWSRLLGRISRAFGLGDTFEAYAVKEREFS